MKQVIQKSASSDMLRVFVSWTLLAGCALSLCAYAYFVNAAVFEALKTRGLTGKIRELSSELNGLETRYLFLKNTTTMTKARELGFTETHTPKFISKKTLGQGLSLRDEI